MGISTMKVTAAYVAGGWPGERYEGNHTFNLVYDEREETSEVKERAEVRAVREVAKHMLMDASLIEIKSVSLERIH